MLAHAVENFFDLADVVSRHASKKNSADIDVCAVFMKSIF
jgi:hypothetical protein